MDILNLLSPANRMTLNATLLGVIVGLANPSLGQDEKPPAPSLFPSGYPDHQQLNASLKKVAADHADVVRLRTLARSGKDREILLLSLGAADGTAPAILVVGNLEADHVVGSAVALELIEALAKESRTAEGKAALAGVTYHFVPRLNADGAESVLKSSPRASFRLNLSAVDRDRDGKAGEDGPDDLDGDGLATKMRIKDASASMIPDEKDKRTLRKADPLKGERGEVSEYIEGLDNDSDGVIGEDPPGGVNLNRHWPHHWTEFDVEAGWCPVSEPEARALVEFAFAHPEIAAVWTFALDESLKNEPKKPGSTLDDADLPIVAELSRQFAKLVKVTPVKATPAGAVTAAADAPSAKPVPVGPVRTAKPSVATSPAPLSLEGTTDGAMSEWAYHQFGVLGLSSRLWASPEIPEPEAGQPPVPGDGEARWLLWNDKVMGGRAFVPFHPFEHPELGAIEIGGWKPGVRINPPFERVEPIAQAHLAFLKDLAGRLPRLELKDVRASAKGAGVFEVSAVVSNEGYLPTALAQGIKTRNAAPILVKIEGEGVRLLSGKPTERLGNLAGSGARVSYRWLILAPEGTKSVVVKAASPKAGRVEKTVELPTP